jgi:hypothetical protein
MNADGTPTVEDVADSKRLTDEIIDLLAGHDVSPYVAAVGILNAFGITIQVVAKESGADPVAESRFWATHLCDLVEMNSAAQNAPRAGERKH